MLYKKNDKTKSVNTFIFSYLQEYIILLYFNFFCEHHLGFFIDNFQWIFFPDFIS